MLCYRWLCVKDDIFIGEWGIFGAEVCLHYREFFLKATLLQAELSVHHYVINSLLYLRTLREKYVKMYKEFIMQPCMYTKEIRILAQGYLLISLITPSKLQEILNTVQTAVLKTSSDYNLVIKRLHLY